jgi:hypothetical protein
VNVAVRVTMKIWRRRDEERKSCQAAQCFSRSSGEVRDGGRRQSLKDVDLDKRNLRLFEVSKPTLAILIGALTYCF